MSFISITGKVDSQTSHEDVTNDKTKTTTKTKGKMQMKNNLGTVFAFILLRGAVNQGIFLFSFDRDMIYLCILHTMCIYLLFAFVSSRASKIKNIQREREKDRWIMNGYEGLGTKSF